VNHVEILSRLIGFQTVSAASNLELIDWTRTYLQDFGITSRLSFNAEGTKANLLATLGPLVDGGLILSGHCDVVPVEGQLWASDPFTATVRGDRLYGRGACDMKGFIAVALSLVPELAALSLERPIHFAFSFDEEVGCLGVRTLLEDFKAIDLSPIGCIVGEPTDMKVVIAHKGAGMYACEITGVAAHSSMAPAGVNAIHYASRIIARLGEMADRLMAHERRHSGFDVPYSTIQVNQITGGIAGNIVADRCRFTIDIRHLPWTRRDDLILKYTPTSMPISFPPCGVSLAIVRYISMRSRTFPPFPSIQITCWCAKSVAAPTRRHAVASPLPPRPVCTRPATFPPWCAALDPSVRRIEPTNSLLSRSSMNARRCYAG
jgi:acetylornithine deacetylase